MSDIDVVCYQAFDGWNCHVTIGDDESKTEHDVSVTRAERDRYGPAVSAQKLVEASFRFLLEREPRESILRAFPLSEIERYFPEYPSEIGGRLGR